MNNNPFSDVTRKKRSFDLDKISSNLGLNGKLTPPQSSSISLNIDDFVGVGDIVSRDGKTGVVVDACFAYSDISKSILINKIRVSWADECWSGIDPFERSKLGITIIHKNSQRLARVVKF